MTKDLDKTQISSTHPKLKTLAQDETDMQTQHSFQPTQPPHSVLASNQQSMLKAPKKIGTGSIINGRFIIDKLLGRGGMGVVYRALDKRKQEAQDRNPYVAIKILGEEFSQHPKAFMALQRECSKSQALAHPNIITVYDFDREGDVVYMTMEQLYGSPLDKLIKKYPNGFSLGVAKKIIRQIGQALAYAHSKSIVHSDLKPANIFVTENNEVKILDFGIARAVSSVDDAQGDNTLFDAGELGGLTPTYASYEMFEGKDPHPGDDIFALGIIAYELLTGKHPYSRKPATVAVQKNLTLEKIKALSRHEWKTIAAATQLKREHRIQDAEQFLKQFAGLSNTIKLLSAGLIIITLGLGSLALYRPNTSGPDILFEQLPSQTQEKVSASISAGNEALKFKDYNGALFFFNSAYEAHPKNTEAVSGLERVIKAIVENMDTNVTGKELAMSKRQINTLLDYSSLADNQQLLKLRDKLATQN